MNPHARELASIGVAALALALVSAMRGPVTWDLLTVFAAVSFARAWWLSR